jgi:hypothetical protein
MVYPQKLNAKSRYSKRHTENGGLLGQRNTEILRLTIGDWSSGPMKASSSFLGRMAVVLLGEGQ